jgi:rubrerythrin
MGKVKKEKGVQMVGGEVEMVGGGEPVIVVQNKRQKRRLEGQLSERRIVKDSYKKNEEAVHFNMGFMPGNSFRCKSCRAGFALEQETKKVCPNCGSRNLVPHSTDLLP